MVSEYIQVQNLSIVLMQSTDDSSEILATALLAVRETMAFAISVGYVIFNDSFHPVNKLLSSMIPDVEKQVQDLINNYDLTNKTEDTCKH